MLMSLQSKAYSEVAEGKAFAAIRLPSGSTGPCYRGTQTHHHDLPFAARNDGHGEWQFKNAR
jgi:hypothetical protein